MAFLLIPAMFLAITPGFYEPLNIFRGLLLPIWLLVYIALKPKGSPPHLKLIGIFALVPIGYIISAIGNKQNPILAFIGHSNRNMGILTFLSMLLILYFFTRESSKPETFLKYGLRPILYFSCLIGLLQVFGIDPIFSKIDERVVLFYGNCNFAAGSLAIVLLVPLFDSFKTNKKKIKIINYTLFVFVLFLGYKTQAVQFYAISLVSISIFILTHYEQQLIKIIKHKSYLLLILSSMGALTVMAALNLESLKKLTNFQDRLSSWKIGYDIFINHPIFGVGIENFWNFQGIYKSPEQQRILGDTIIVDKSHNVFIDQFANGGVITGISFICFILATIYLLLKANFSSLSPNNRLYFSLFSAVWTGYIFQLFFSPDNIVVMTIAYSCLAMMIRIASTSDMNALKSKKQIMQKNSSLVRSMAVLLLLPLTVLSYKAINYEVTVRKILLNKIVNGNQIIEVIKSYPNPKAVESIIVHEIEQLDNCPFVNPASDELLKINPRSAQAWYFKTICLDHVSDYSTALQFVNKSLETQPITLSYLDAKCRLEARLGKNTEAAATLAKIKQIFPESTRISELQKVVQNSSTT